MDLYAHTSGGMPTVIARTGIDGEYMSGLPFSYGQIAPLTEARQRAQAAGLLEYNLGSALAYSTPEDPRAYDELKAAITLSPEWRAFLTFEAGDIPDSQKQVSALVASAFEKNKALDKNAMPLGSCFEVTQRIDKMLQVMRGLNQHQSMLASQAVTDFVVGQLGSPADTPNPFQIGD